MSTEDRVTHLELPKMLNISLMRNSHISAHNMGIQSLKSTIGCLSLGSYWVTSMTVEI